MVRVFKHYIPKSVFVLGLIECLALIAAIWAAMHLRFAQIGIGTPVFGEHLIEIWSFVGIVYVSMLAAGLYELETCRDLRVTLIRLVASLVIAVVGMAVVFYLIPDVDIWRSVIILSLSFSILFILLSRYTFSKVVNLKRFNKRVVVLGAGTRAAKVRELANDEKAAVTFVGFLRMADNEQAIDDAIDYKALPSLSKFLEDFL